MRNSSPKWRLPFRLLVASLLVCCCVCVPSIGASSSRKLHWFKIPKPVADVYRIFKSASFKGNGTSRAVTGEKSCFTITTEDETGFKVDTFRSVTTWRIILSLNSGNTWVPAHVKYIPSLGVHEACYVLRKRGIYRATAYLEYVIDDEYKVYGTPKYFKVMSFPVLATEKKDGSGDMGLLGLCAPEFLKSQHNRYGIWEGKKYQFPSCELLQPLPNKAMNCLSGKNIAVFGDPSFKILATLLSEYLGNTTFEESFFKNAPYSLTWFQSYSQTTFSQTYFDPDSGEIPYLSLRLNHRVSAQLYGTSWDGYGRIRILPICEGQKSLDLWVFSHHVVSELPFRPWMLDGEKFGRLWFPSSMKFDYIITGDSVYDPANFDDLNLYKGVMKMYVKGLLPLVRNSVPDRIIWLGNMHNQNPQLGDPKYIFEVAIGGSHGIHRQFSEVSFQVAEDMGLTWFDLLPTRFPSFDRRAENELLDKDHSPQSMKAIINLLLSSICSLSSLVSSPPGKCIDHSYLRNTTEGLPLVPTRLAIGHEMEMIEDPGEEFDPDNLVGNVRSSESSDSRKVNSSQQGWVSTDFLSQLRMKPSIPGDRVVVMSVKELRKWKKKEEDSMAAKTLKNQELLSGGEGDSSLGRKFGWPIQLKRSQMTWQNTIQWETSVRLHPIVAYFHSLKCEMHRTSYCYNGASKYRTSCPWKDDLTQVVAFGLMDRCEKWCPTIKECKDVIPNSKLLSENLNQQLSVNTSENISSLMESNLRQITRRFSNFTDNKPSWVGFINQAFISRCGDVYTDRYVLFPRGECYVWNGPPYHCSLDFNHAIEHVSQKVYVADGKADDIYSMVFECIASIMPYYDELMDDKSIFIHVKGIEEGDGEYPKRLAELFELIDLSPSRIISHDVYASEVIVGRPTCRIPYSIHEVNYLKRLRNLIHQKLQNSNNDLMNNQRHILVIQNPWHRKVLNLDELLNSLRKITNHTIVTLEDDGTLPLLKLWTAFFNAFLIIGPHGNSLVHAVACRTGTALLEFMVPFSDYDDPVHANIFYELVATSLGMPYYVMSPEYHVPFEEGNDGDPYFVANIDQVIRFIQDIQQDLALGLSRWEKNSDVRYYNYTI